MAGEGIALADDLLAAEHLLTGRLVKPLPQVRTADYRQQLFLRTGTERPDAVAAFRDWLVDEVAHHARMGGIWQLPNRFRPC